MRSDQRHAVSRRALLAASAQVGSLATGLLPAGLFPSFSLAAVGKKGGTLNTILSPEPPVLVLGVNNQGPTIIAASKIFQGLLRFSPKLEPLPCLAKSWELSDDRKTYTFHLQPGVTFHDGSPFTADDVIFSLMKFNMEVAPRARAILQMITEATAPDPMTVKLTLSAPFEPFLLMFDVSAMVIVSKKVYDGTDYRNTPANQHPIGTGPFQFTEWQRGNFIRMTRYEKYWEPDEPYLDEIIYRIVPDSQSRSLALETGKVQLTGASDIEPFDVPRFRARPNLTVSTEGWQYFSPLSWIEINHRVKPLDDVRVRLAISLAIDRDFLVQKLWFGLGKPATGPIASTTRYYDPALKKLPHDTKKAIALLDAAGLKPNAQGVRVTLKHLVLPYGEIWARLSEYLRASLHQIGIELVLETTDAGAWSSRVGGWDYETTINFLYQFGDPTLGVERSYVSSNIKKVTFTNTGGYANPKVDALFAQARAEGDPADRQKAFSAVQDILVQDMPQVWLMELAFPTIYDRKLQNITAYGTGVQSNFNDVFFA
jgi:peptide/nickel transport system substrate-binding protein